MGMVTAMKFDFTSACALAYERTMPGRAPSSCQGVDAMRRQWATMN